MSASVGSGSARQEGNSSGTSSRLAPSQTERVSHRSRRQSSRSSSRSSAATPRNHQGRDDHVHNSQVGVERHSVSGYKDDRSREGQSDRSLPRVGGALAAELSSATSSGQGLSKSTQPLFDSQKSVFGSVLVHSCIQYRLLF